MTTPEANRTPARTLARRPAVVVATLALIAFVGATARLFVWPSMSSPSRVDAIVVFGASSPERLPDALRLADEGRAPVLVLMSPPPEDAVCRDQPDVEVVCLVPSPFTTIGEARAAGGLAASRGWDSLLVVTSTYHLTRARLHLERCFDGTVHGVGTGMSDGFGKNVERIAHEWGALVAALTIGRGC